MLFHTLLFHQLVDFAFQTVNMDRTDELLRATQLFSSIDFSRSSARSPEPSSFIVCAGRVSSYLDGNETLVRRMNKL